MRNHKKITQFISSLVMAGCFMMVQQTAAQYTWSENEVGFHHDRFTVNDNNSNHWSSVRLQAGNNNAWNMMNGGDLWWSLSNQPSHVDLGSEKMRLTTDGKLGIGTGINIAAGLHVVSDETNQFIIQPKTAGNNALAKIIGHGTNTTGVNQAQLLFQNYDEDITDTHSLGMIAGKVTDDVANHGDLVFYNYANGENAKETMRLTRSGHVGIGTAVPNNNTGWGRVLDVHHNLHAKMLVTTNTNDVKTGIFSHSNWYPGLGAMGVVGTESNHDLILMAGNNGHHVTVKTGGNVGIGTMSPSAKLDVNGTGHFSNDVNIDGDVGIGTVSPSAKLDVNGTGHFSGDVGIGTTSPTEKLHVIGNIKADGVILNIGSFPDYVFEPDYPLLPLKEVESYIKTNKHLPGFPSESEVIKTGANLGQLNNLLVEKVEELTLYTIAQEKQIDKLSSELNLLKGQLAALLKEQ